MDKTEYDQILKDVPTGALLMKVMHRARIGQSPGSDLHWQWCSMLEGLMVPLLKSLPSSILDSTDLPFHSYARLSVQERVDLERKLEESKNLRTQIKKDMLTKKEDNEED